MTESEKTTLLEMYARDKGIDSLGFLRKSLHGKPDMTEANAREALYWKIFNEFGISANEAVGAIEKAWEWAFSTFDSQVSPEEMERIDRKIIRYNATTRENGAYKHY